MADSTTTSANASLGRNEPCHCESGKKYKQCCLAKDEDAARKARAEANARAAAAAAEAPEADEAASKAKEQPHHPHRQRGGGAPNSRGFQKSVGGPRKVGGG